MDSKTIVMCVVALLLGMLMANMLKDVCGCNVVEGQTVVDCNQCLQSCPPPGTPEDCVSNVVFTAPSDLQSGVGDFELGS